MKRNLNTKSIGDAISKFGLVLLLLWIGIFKFTPTEAKAIEPLMVNSPFFSWQLNLMPLQTVSNLIGAIEILVAIFILFEFKFKKLAQIGYLIGVIMFLSTLSFLFTTPNMFGWKDGVLTTDWFILKDLLLLGYCVSKLNLKLLFPA